MLRQDVSVGPFGGQKRLSGGPLDQSDPDRVVHHVGGDPRRGQIQLKLGEVLENRRTWVGGDGVSHLGFGERLRYLGGWDGYLQESQGIVGG